MCGDSPIRTLKDYVSVSLLTQRVGPVTIMAHDYRGLLRETTSFFPSFCARNKPSLVNEAQADYGIMRQVAERG